MFTHKTGVSISFEVDGIKLQSTQLREVESLLKFLHFQKKKKEILLDIHVHVD